MLELKNNNFLSGIFFLSLDQNGLTVYNLSVFVLLLIFI
jgi:hypothetical protein